MLNYPTDLFTCLHLYCFGYPVPRFPFPIFICFGFRYFCFCSGNFISNCFDTSYFIPRPSTVTARVVLVDYGSVASASVASDHVTVVSAPLASRTLDSVTN